VLSGSVSVRFVEVAGLSIVKVAVPVLAPAIEIFDIILLLPVPPLLLPKSQCALLLLAGL